MRFASLVCLVALVLAWAVSGVSAADRLITIDEGSYTDTHNAVETIGVYGGRVKFVFPPHFIIADIPDDAEAGLLTARPISAIHSGELDPADFARYGTAARHVIAAWNNVFVGKAYEMGLDREPSPDRLPLVNDVLTVDDRDLLLKPPGAKIYDTSEFLMGSVALGVILPESDGTGDPSSENWTQTEQDNVTSEIIAGLNWYVTKADYLPLSWYTLFHYSVPTSYEPITRSSGQEYLWREECLTYLGFGGRYDYVNWLRDSLDTEWAVLALVVDSSNDADNCFSDGRFAYSYLGGPNLVMTYGNDGWGIANMDAVVAHELGHSFWALDEYFEGYEGCTARSGYLNSENQNSEYPNGPGGCLTNKIFCIMRGVSLGSARVCYYTKGQIGWWDDDGDSLPNLLDTCPETELYEYSPDPCSTFTPTYAGSSWVTAVSNLNPRKSNPHDITLNRIAKVEYRVDSGSWNDAAPNDGAWDEGKEGFHFTPDPLSDTTHIFEARAIHTYGNHDTTYAVDTLTIESTSGIDTEVAGSSFYIKTYPNPFGPRVRVSYSVPGQYGRGVAVSMRIYDVRGREVMRLIDGVRSPGPGKISWDGAYANGNLAPSGIYFIDLVAGDSRLVRKLVMTR
jgi:hypothetical protein